MRILAKQFLRPLNHQIKSTSGLHTTSCRYYGNDHKHLLSALLSTLLALVYGAISGLAPGAWDALLMRFCELLMSLPSLILVLFLQAVWGKPTPTSIAVVLALTSWMTLAKLVRSEVRRIRESDYILSAKIMGADFTYLLQKHLLPNLISPAMFCSSDC